VDRLPRIFVRSLGTGIFPRDGPIVFISSAPPTVASSAVDDGDEDSLLVTPTGDLDSDGIRPLTMQLRDWSTKKKQCCFMRTSDLAMDGGPSNNNDKAHYHYSTNDPPPGVTHDPKERWVALDDGHGFHTAIAPAAIDALARCVLDFTMDRSMWTPNYATQKLMKGTKWDELSWNKDDPIPNLPSEKDVLVWTGSFSHGCYGSELPGVRACGMVPMSPFDLMSLLLDSSRINEYNKMSLGRTDMVVLQEGMDGPFKGITKIVKNESKVMRKTMQLVTLLHSRPLPCTKDAFMIVSRAVTRPSDPVDLFKTEILTGVNILLPVGTSNDCCFMINVNHMKSPIPLMIAKKVGLTAAVNFFHDLRNL